MAASKYGTLQIRRKAGDPRSAAEVRTAEMPAAIARTTEDELKIIEDASRRIRQLCTPPHRTVGS